MSRTTRITVVLDIVYIVVDIYEWLLPLLVVFSKSLSEGTVPSTKNKKLFDTEAPKLAILPKLYFLNLNLCYLKIISNHLDLGDL